MIFLKAINHIAEVPCVISYTTTPFQKTISKKLIISRETQTHTLHTDE